MIIVKQIALSCVNRNIPCFELNHQFVYSIIDHFLFMNKLVSLVVLSIEREGGDKDTGRNKGADVNINEEEGNNVCICERERERVYDETGGRCRRQLHEKKKEYRDLGYLGFLVQFNLAPVAVATAAAAVTGEESSLHKAKQKSIVTFFAEFKSFFVFLSLFLLFCFPFFSRDTHTVD